MSASQIKSGRPPPEAPRAGSQLREVYDLFLANRGRPIEIGHWSNLDPNWKIKLQDFYGFDIRCVQRGYCRPGYDDNRPSLYVLAGEWVGRTYLDYIAQHLTSLEKQGAA